jgi:hypothetical protein
VLNIWRVTTELCRGARVCSRVTTELQQSYSELQQSFSRVIVSCSRVTESVAAEL